jgi:hypothetical protein
MKPLLKELWGLFVDDDVLAVDLLAWCALAALLLPAVLPRDIDTAAFFIGCLVVLLGNVTVAAMRVHHRAPTAHAVHASAEFQFRGGEHTLP